MVTVTAAELAQGMRDGALLLHYQPQASLISNRIVGAEALARWTLPNGAMLPPAGFIAVAERTGLIRQLTLYLLAKLVDDMASAGMAGLCVSFNVTASDLEGDALSGQILDHLAHGRLRPTMLQLEITETQALHAGAHMRRNVEALAEAGVGLSMDDYGVGYSSMDTLSQWPFTSIKLDQGVIGRMLNSAKNATIVRSSIRLGHELGVTVVAEGVEVSEQHDFLVEAGCRLAQGYLFSRPLPLDAFEVFRTNIGKCRGMPIGLVHMAIVDHVQWRRQMVSHAIQRSALPPDSPVRAMDGYPALCRTECALGKWYAGDGRYFAGTAMYAAIDAPHRTLHDVGAEIVTQLRAGADLRAIVPLLHDLKQASSTLIRLLEDLEDAGLQALYASAPTA